MVWNIVKLKGTRAAVQQKLGAEQVPDDVKTFIASQVESLPSDTLAVVVNAYCQDVTPPNALKTTRNCQITIEAIRI